MRRVHVVAHADPQVQRPPSGMRMVEGHVERRARVPARTGARMGAVQDGTVCGRRPGDRDRGDDQQHHEQTAPHASTDAGTLRRLVEPPFRRADSSA